MDTLTLLIIAVVCAAVGYIGGVLVSTLHGDRSADDQPAEEKPLDETVLVEARLLREAPGDALRVEMNGKVFTNGADLTAPQRDHLENLMLELKSFLGLSSAFSTAPAAPQPEPTSETAEDEPNPVFTAPVVGVSQPTAAAPIQLYPAPAKPASKREEKSMVGQIDDIFQAKLAGTPYAGKNVRLAESPTHGVVVRIGQEQYPGIDAVPDPEIQALIRQAVAAWEANAK